MRDHPADWTEERLLAECDMRRERRSGPGGQHRNKVETAVVLTHRPSGISAEANERRSQAENRQIALFRLRLRLADQLRSPVSLEDPPSSLWKSRVRGGKIAVNPSHDDFPSMLAEGLDYLAAADWDAKLAAQSLSCSTTQLVRFLKDEPAAFQRLNEQRKERGLRPLT
ncbi:peptide chain release factor-like protein [Blastopirellula sp. JC732]|uniref:Peptide chain release factor-like protein n=1 Tax=Blastopirellula sediminis TaxID=2894196 RepID=A0A9X1MHS5_9BACT|nr:peptide chain release factor-like protein [Blastopirellula sediminis]MCC9607854.1 peptide chain release factor-like protein [Blastopirellula sediminis]MCC9627353.1 peptide chain release factor-like protein [Blastopirellula sediminis]